MNILTGIQKVLQFINDNWTAIVIILGLATAVGKKVVDFYKQSDDKKIETAKKQLKETMLKLITDAETDYWEWVDAGAIKRSQVIDKIFEMYPILNKVTNQEELIVWIDKLIDESLEILRDIIEKQALDEADEVPAE